MRPSFVAIAGMVFISASLAGEQGTYVQVADIGLADHCRPSGTTSCARELPNARSRDRREWSVGRRDLFFMGWSTP